MGRTDSKWQTKGSGTYIETISPTGYDILINGTNKYLNFNITSGSSGYGFRDNNGSIEVKNSGGTWGTIPSSGSPSGFLQNNIGIAGGTTLIGGTASGENLTLSSTSHATKGKILFGTSAYDEVNNRLGINTSSPGALLEVNNNSTGTSNQVAIFRGNSKTGAASDEAYMSMFLSDSAGTQKEHARLGWSTSDPSPTASVTQIDLSTRGADALYKVASFKRKINGVVSWFSGGDENQAISWSGTGFNFVAGGANIFSLSSSGYAFMQNNKHFKMNSNSGKLYFGAADNASILYNGTNLVLNSQESGVGDTVILNGKLGISTATPGRKLDILDTSNPQLRLTYTDNSVYTDFQTNSSGYLLLTPSGGSVLLGTTSLNASEVLSVTKSYSNSGGVNGTYFNMTFTPSTTVSAGVYGNQFQTRFTGSNQMTNAKGFLGRITISNSGSGIYDNYFSYIETSGSTANASTLRNFNSTLSWGSAGTVTNYYGFYTEIASNAGTITNTYGIYVGDVTTGTQTNQAYSLYLSDTNARNLLSGATNLADTYNAGSGSLAGSLLDMTQTWNTSGTPTAVKLNVTDTASNSSSLLMDLQVGGSSRFKVTKSGSGTFNSYLYSGVAIGISSKSIIKSDTNGNFTLLNAAETDFSLLKFGGTTSIFPALKRSTASLLTVLADDSGPAVLRSSVLISPKSSSPVTVANTDVETVYTNEGATSEITFNLPTAVAGLTYTFYVQDTDGLKIVANTGDTIRIGSVVSASAGYAESLVVGSSVTLTAINATEWVATSSIGTWTVV